MRRDCCRNVLTPPGRKPPTLNGSAGSTPAQGIRNPPQGTTERDDTMKNWTATYPLTATDHLEYWTALRNHFAAKCSAARISGEYPAQFRAWEAEVRRADVRLHMLAR